MSKSHLIVVDGLRGIAVLLVIMSHISGFGFSVIPLLSFQGIGKAGVYLFFVLSAWLLSSILLKHIGSWSILYWLAYGVRRLCRIFPLYLIVLTFCLSLTALSVPFWVIPLDAHQYLRHIFLLDGDAVFWAIPVEFRFYLILPLLVASFVFLAQWHRVLPLVACVVMIFLPVMVPLGGIYESNTTNLWAYFSAFSMGIFIALVQFYKSDRKPPCSRVGLEVIGSIALLLVFLSVPAIASGLLAPLGVLGSGEKLSPDVFHPYVLIYSVLWGAVLVAAYRFQDGFGNIFRIKPLVWIGERSFSIYLCHIPVLRFVQSLNLDQPLVEGWVALCISLILSHFLFISVEKPGIRLGKRITADLQ